MQDGYLTLLAYDNSRTRRRKRRARKKQRRFLLAATVLVAFSCAVLFLLTGNPI